MVMVSDIIQPAKHYLALPPRPPTLLWSQMKKKSWEANASRHNRGTVKDPFHTIMCYDFWRVSEVSLLDADRRKSLGRLFVEERSNFDRWGFELCDRGFDFHVIEDNYTPDNGGKQRLKNPC